MVVSESAYRNAMIVVGVVAVALLPFWPYSRWGYLPTTAAVALVLIMLGVRTLSRD